MAVSKESLFAKRVAGDFPFPGHVIEISGNDTVDHAFKVLAKNNILSAPVYDQDKKEYLGFLDLSDALTMIFTLDTIASILPEDWLDKSAALRLARGEKGQQIKVHELFEHANEEDFFSKRPDWRPVFTDAPMEEVLRILSTSARRVPVIDKMTGKVIKIISQSQVTRFIDLAIQDLEKAGKNPPSPFGRALKDVFELGKKEIYAVSATENTARDAFTMILEKGVSAVGVLDEDGKILSSISTKDIRMFKNLESVAAERLAVNMGRGKHAMMDMKAVEFVSAVREAYEKNGMASAAAVVVSEDTTLARVIAKLGATQKHRVFVVDKERTPIGVISVSDIAKLLSSS